MLIHRFINSSIKRLSLPVPILSAVVVLVAGCGGPAVVPPPPASTPSPAGGKTALLPVNSTPTGSPRSDAGNETRAAGQNRPYGSISTLAGSFGSISTDSRVPGVATAARPSGVGTLSVACAV